MLGLNLDALAQDLALSCLHAPAERIGVLGASFARHNEPRQHPPKRVNRLVAKERDRRRIPVNHPTLRINGNHRVERRLKARIRSRQAR